jgi:hypothetical protein
MAEVQDDFGTFDIKLQIQIQDDTTLKFTAWTIASNAGFDADAVIQGRPAAVTFPANNTEHVQLILRQNNPIAYPPMLFNKPLFWQSDKIKLKKTTAAIIFHLVLEKKYLVGSKLVPLRPQAELDAVARQKLSQLEAAAQATGVAVFDVGPKSKDRPH